MAQRVLSAREGQIRALSTVLPRGIASPLFRAPLNNLSLYLDRLHREFSSELLLAVLQLAPFLSTDRYIAVLNWAYCTFDVNDDRTQP